jgi:hypothetical protein
MHNSNRCSPFLFSTQLGTLQQSENGLENAEKFYRVVRPYEGLARIQKASAVTESGYKFTTYTNAV